MAHLRARIHPPWNAEKSLSPLKKFFPFQERKNCSYVFFLLWKKKERKKERREKESKLERGEEWCRKKGEGEGWGALFPRVGRKRASPSWRDCLSLIKISHNPFHVLWQSIPLLHSHPPPLSRLTHSRPLTGLSSRILNIQLFHRRF